MATCYCNLNLLVNLIMNKPVIFSRELKIRFNFESLRKSTIKRFIIIFDSTWTDNKFLSCSSSGLGKEEQGMASALQVEKTGRQRGVIVNESEERAKARIEVSKQEEGL